MTTRTLGVDGQHFHTAERATALGVLAIIGRADVVAHEEAIEQLGAGALEDMVSVHYVMNCRLCGR